MHHRHHRRQRAGRRPARPDAGDPAASAWEEWLDPENDDIEALGRLLAPAPAGELTLHPVGPEVNDVRNSGSGLIKAVEPDEPGQVAIQGTLL